MPPATIVISNLPSELRTKLGSHLSSLIENALKQKEKLVVIGVSGGSMPPLLSTIIIEDLAHLNWSRVRLFAVDERLVPLQDPDSNTGVYLDRLPPAFRQRFAILQGALENGPACALEYEKCLRAWLPDCEDDSGLPRFDLLLLGMGPDGHTCSLFPDHPLLEAGEGREWIVCIEDSPKPPPRRVTITVPVINNAQHVAFVVTGASKADIVREILVEGNRKYPAGLVHPLSGNLHWFLDAEAGSKL